MLVFVENTRATVKELFGFRTLEDWLSDLAKAEEFPAIVRMIVPEKPLMLAKVIVDLPVEPCVKLNEA